MTPEPYSRHPLSLPGQNIITPGMAVVPTPDEYRRKARLYLSMAATATDPVAASSLRTLAADFLELAQDATPVAQQQQQIQPKEPKGDGG
jgi:hypothetical protein